jgi:hypothetical protein
MRRVWLLVTGLGLALSAPAQGADGALQAFLAETGKLDGHELDIRTSNGPIQQGMKAELHADGPSSFSVMTSVKAGDGAMTLFSRETYVMQPDEPGLTPGHFRTQFARSNGKVSIPLSCDTFLFAGQSLQLDCYRPENFKPERKLKLEITIIWDMKPNLFDIRIITSAGVATLSAPR